FIIIKPNLISQLEQEDDPWIPDQAMEGRPNLLEPHIEFPGGTIKLEQEEVPVWDHPRPESNTPFLDTSSEFLDVKIKQEQEEVTPFSRGHPSTAVDQQGFPGVIIKLEPKEEPCSPDPCVSEESATVSSIQLGEGLARLDLG
ncbi:hypothetical protein lerEdw1_010941, partial [Lerista edwardsae]